MKVLLKKAKILNSNSPYHGMHKDILIENGFIKKIENSIEEKEATVIESNSLHVSLGWVDIKSSFCDPGYEHKETLDSGLDAAAAGGYTHVFSLPNTLPICDNKSIIEYQFTKSSSHAVQLHPMGAITKTMKGEELAEMFDMMQTGARLFTDDLKPLNTGMLQRALLYAKNIGATLCLSIRDENLSRNTLVNEGMASIQTGLKADPSVGEVIQLQTIIKLLQYTESSAHISGVSCKESIEIIKQAKSNGISISCDVNLMNVLFTEEDVLSFDHNMKVLPVLRSQEDKKNIYSALNNGTIDVIASDHRPADPEEKEIEFDHASFGCYQLQTVFSSLHTFSNLALETIIKIMSENPRRMTNIDMPLFEIDQPADLTIFDPNIKWNFSEEKMISSYNYSPFMNKDFNGKVIGIFNKNQLVLVD